MDTNINIKKIQKILNIGVSDYYEGIKNIGAFVSKLRSDLRLRQSGQWNSTYNTEPFVLPSGDTLTIRIADHKANSKQFENHFNTKYNVVLLIGENTKNIEIHEYIESEV